ncbi:MAG TPA: ROK family protein, partial [Streptomyces sp.]|nr:ROK family protein [Streptomyces sp.]
MHTDLVVALDIGGTKIAGALVGTGGELLVRAQRPTPPRAQGERVMAAVGEVLEELAASP